MYASNDYSIRHLAKHNENITNILTPLIKIIDTYNGIANYENIANADNLMDQYEILYDLLDDLTYTEKMFSHAMNKFEELEYHTNICNEYSRIEALNWLFFNLSFFEHIYDVYYKVFREILNTLYIKTLSTYYTEGTSNMRLGCIAILGESFGNIEWLDTNIWYNLP